MQRNTELQNSPESQVSIAESVSRHSLFNVEKSLVANLLEEAIGLLDRDRPVARKRIEEAFALVRSNGDDNQVQTSKLARWQLARAEDYIRQHLGSRLRIGAVAKSVNLSPSHFSRAFKAARGVSFTEYVRISRIEHAKTLLLRTKSPIAQIAQRCGLADQSHLSRVFLQTVGSSPRAWRARRIADQFEAESLRMDV